MNIFIAIFKFFPYGGLQRDFLQLVEELLKRKHHVKCVCMKWEGPIPEGLTVQKISVFALSNHRKAALFGKKARTMIQNEKPDCTITMNRIAGCDFYFAGDNCLAYHAPKTHSAFYMKFSPRYHVFLHQESSIFDAKSGTRIFTLVKRQQTEYQKIYRTPDSRFILLPPGISKNRIITDGNEIIKRKEIRTKLHVNEKTVVLIQIALHAVNKGVDRVIDALNSLPPAICSRDFLYIVVGINDSGKKKYKMAPKIADKIVFAGPQDDVMQYLLASDFMIHPARNEATGTVLMESIAAECPVLCSGECGFSKYVEESGGIVLGQPFSSDEFSQALKKIICSPSFIREKKRLVGAYARKCNFYRRMKVMADEIENFMSEKKRKSLQ